MFALTIAKANFKILKNVFTLNFKKVLSFSHIKYFCENTGRKFSKDDLKKRLNSMELYVTQEKGTEPAFTGEYWNNKEKGIYSCIVCDENLFNSDHKFDSGTGWPSFYDVVKHGVHIEIDTSHRMVREEVTCKNCGSHLGHVFNDGPKPTNKRYCINSASLLFKKE